jgi:hypothetical protein
VRPKEEKRDRALSLASAGTLKRSNLMGKLASASAILALLTAIALPQPLQAADSAKDKPSDSLEKIELTLSVDAKLIVGMRDGRSRCDTDQCRLVFDEAVEARLQLLAAEIEYRLARLHTDADAPDLLSERYQAARAKAWELSLRVVENSGPMPTCNLPCAKK